MMYTIQDFKREKVNRGLIQSDYQDCWTAIVKADNGDWIGVSRYHDEAFWVVDCAFRANGYPVFSNGTGTRCGTVARTINADIEAQLQEKVESWSLSES
jgi:hypothetical protein